MPLPNNRAIEMDDQGWLIEVREEFNQTGTLLATDAVVSTAPKIPQLLRFSKSFGSITSVTSEPLSRIHAKDTRLQAILVISATTVKRGAFQVTNDDALGCAISRQSRQSGSRKQKTNAQLEQSWQNGLLKSKII
jgi:hypothetical protein